MEDAVEGPAAFDSQTADDPSALGIAGKHLQRLSQLAVKCVYRLETLYGGGRLMPANHVQSEELHLGYSLGVYANEIATPSALLTN